MPEPDPACECPETEHYLPCDCEVSGTEDCACTVKLRGHVTERRTSVQVPIYQSAGVTDEQAAAATTNIIAGFDNLVIGHKVALEGKLKEIRIVTNTNNDNGYDGNYDYEISDSKIIIKIKSGLDANDSTMCFSLFVNGDLPGLTLSQAPVRNTVRLAGVPAKQFVAPALQFGKRQSIRFQHRAAMAIVK